MRNTSYSQDMLIYLTKYKLLAIILIGTVISVQSYAFQASFNSNTISLILNYVPAPNGLKPIVENGPSTPEKEAHRLKENAHCNSISPLPCEQILAKMPLTLQFDGTEGGLNNSGFTLALPHSAERLQEDGPVADAGVNGYEPSKLTANDGLLTLTSSKGIMYRDPSVSTSTNTQVNALGVGVPLGLLQKISTTLEKPFAGVASSDNGSQQAGLWYGVDDNNYVKLALIKVNNSTAVRAQLLVESYGNSTTGALPLEINSVNIADPRGQSVTLTLEFDAVAGKVVGYYQIGSGTKVLVSSGSGTSVTNSLPVPEFIRSGLDHDANPASEKVLFTGIFATHRNSVNPVDFQFSRFEIQDFSAPVAVPFRINAAGPQRTVGDDIFVADEYFSPKPGEFSNASYTGLIGTSSPELYYDRRFGGTMSYNIPIENGNYTVRLHMVENFHSAAGARVFDVAIEKKQVLTDLDLFVEGGGQNKQVITKDFNVSVDDNRLDIDFTASKDKAILSAIEILPASVASNQPPVFNEPTYSFTIDETMAAGREIGTVSASDPDGNDLTYSITEGNEAGKFSINASTGVLAVAASLEQESATIYNLLVSATDNGSPVQSESTQVVINVNEAEPVNSSPVFSQATYQFTLSETAAINSSVGSITAEDAEGDLLVYAITAGNDSGYFSLDQVSGEILVAKQLLPNNYTLAVSATETEGEGLSATAQVSISVTPKAAVAAALGADKQELAFVSQPVGTESAPQVITLQHTGEAGSANVLLSEISADNAAFIVSVPSATELQPGGSATANVTFKPISAGITNSILSITHDGSNSPLTIDLAGEGEAVISGCAPISTIPCEDLNVNLPFNLNFTGNEGSLANTGFTMADAYSAAGRDGADGEPSSNVKGFEPSKLSFENEALKFITNKGIAFLGNNNQVNSLGVKFDATNKFTLETTLINPFNGTQSQQAGIWFGLSDKSFIKLVVTGNKVEMRRELNDISSTVSTNNPDQRITPVISGLNNEIVRLRLIVDPVAQTAEAFYSVDGANYINVGENYSIKSVDIANMGVTVSGAYAGIQATHRNGTTPVTYTFDNFSITPEQAPVNKAPVFAASTYSFTASTTAEVGTLVGSVSATDEDDDEISYAISAGNEQNLFAISTAGEISVAAALAPAQHVLTVSASDGKDETTATVNVNVTEEDPINTAPIAVADVASAYHGSPLHIDILVNDTDAEGNIDPASVVITIEPEQGSVVVDATTGAITYTPAALGTHTFSYTVADKQGEVSEPTEVIVSTGVKINFQNMATVPPAEYLKDYGQGFGVRSGANQGSGLSYGWKDLSDLNDTPLDLTGNGRNRIEAGYSSASLEEKLRGTLMHLQGNHPAVFNGNTTEGKWEISVPNGRYKVTAGVGDPNIDGQTADIPKHSINVEGVAAVISFIPAGTVKDNSGPRHTSHTVVVDVTDGLLTIDAFDGFNTKINSLVIAPTTEPAAGVLAFGPNPLEISAFAGGAPVSSNVALSGTPVPAGVTPKLFGTVPNWLAVPQGAFGDLSFTATPGTLSPMVYTTEVRARAVGYSFATLPVIFTLDDPQHTEADFAAFELADATGAISEENHTVSVSVAPTTDLTSLVATFSLSSGASAKVGDVLQISGETANDFTNPVTYSITAEDGVTMQEWVVTVTKASAIATLEASPSGLVFSSQTVGTTSELQTITLTHTGEAGSETIVLGQVSSTDDAFVATVPESTTLAAGESTTFSVTFAPVVVGETIAKLLVPYNNKATPIEIQLTGTGEAESEPIACSAISTLPCSEVPVSLPLNLSFNGSEGGLSNTGFTMADPPSARLIADGAVTYVDVPGFEPNKLSFSSGQLVIASNKGIQYSQLSSQGSPNSTETNSQINALGVGFNALAKPVQIQTTLINLDFTTSDGNNNSQQAGLWFGLNEDNYVKLVIYRNNAANAGAPELLIEERDANGTLIVGGGNDGIRNLKPAVTISNLSSRAVTLRLELDPLAKTVTAHYRVDGGEEINMGTLSLPAKFFNGIDHDKNADTESVSFAGLFATHRRATNPFNAKFEDFSIKPTQDPVNRAPVVATAPQDQTLTVGTAFSFSAGEFKDDDGDVLTYTATLADDSELPSWLLFNAADLTFSGTAPSIVTNLSVKVIASDGSEAVNATFAIEVKEAAPIIACSGISNLPCPEIIVSLNTPYVLDFTGDAGGLVDKAGVGTGFKMVDKPSARLEADGTPAYPEIPGYEPSKLEVTGGLLKVITNRGISYLKPSGAGSISPRTNSQINTLGVGLNASTQKFIIETSIVNPYVGNKAEQAGLWYGLDEDNFIKLVVNNGAIELRRELGAVSGQTAADVVNSGASPIAGISTSTVKLKLLIDNTAGTVAGFYTINGGAEIQVGGSGATMSIPTLIAGKTVGEVPSISFAGIFATHRNAGDPNFGTLLNPPVYSFDNFRVEAVSPVENTLVFSPLNLSYTALQGAAASAQSATLTANQGAPEVSLEKTANSDWLILPANGLGALSFNVSTTGLGPGNYTATVTATAPNYTNATLDVSLTVNSPVAAKEIKVNFQDPNTVPPSGWVRDYGQPFGARVGQHQGSDLTYGWKKRSDGSALDLSVGGNTPGNGRNRNSPSDVLLATLMHMQADDISGTFNGTAVEGYWEVKVPNGIYDVTISVGDASVGSDPESHTINVEGENAISGFLPSGNAGSLTRFKSGTVRVTVSDEHLTINADGGTNTKINSALILPVSTDPSLHWSASSQSMIIDQDPSITDKTFSLDLSKAGNSEESQIEITATYGEGATGWLSFNATHNSNEPNVTFDYTAAKDLALGTYSATVTASAEGYVSGSFTVQVTVVEPGSMKPYVISSTPANGETNVALNPTISANNIYAPGYGDINGGVDNSTINSETVKLLKVNGSTTTSILGTVQGTGGGDAISFSPTYALEPNTSYKFIITDGVKSLLGEQFIPYEAAFTTGSESGEPNGPIAVEFKPEAVPGTQGKKYTTVTFGPDGKFYALRLDGTIERYNIDHSTGLLSGVQEIKTLVTKYGNRSAVGLTFDPSSTSANLIAWVSHCSSGLDNAPEFDGNLSKLTGSNLETEQLVLTKLPRSKKDHLVNSIAFGPDGALYFNQGSNSAMGAYDGTWQRNESLLAGAVLRLDLNKLNGISLPLNVQTTSNQSVINAAPAGSVTMSDGTYNPYASNSPLTIFASGVRNAYDLVWHSNGHLYVPANGSAAGGASPASVAGTRRPDGSVYNGPSIPATSSIQVQRDWLFRVNPNKPVGYYGHANPLRGEYVTNRGYVDNNKYLSGTVADVNYRGAAFDFEFNKSPNGVIEYKSNAFNGALKGWILVCRFSGGSDIIALKPGTMTPTSDQTNDGIYNIVESRTGSGTNGIPGLGGLSNPLDIVEDVETGNLYVIEYNWNNASGKATQITLLKATTPSAPAALVSVSPEQVLDNAVVGATAVNRTVTVANKGNATLAVSRILLEGTDASQFVMSSVANLPINVAPNSATTFNIAFKPTTTGVKAANVRVSSNGGSDKLVRLGGLGTAGEGGNNEPSLQAIMDVYGIQVNVGDDDPSTNIIHSNTTQQKAALLGDEVSIQKFERAVDGPVTIEPLAVFGPQHSGGVVTGFGWYTSGDANAKNELFTVGNNNFQTIRVNAAGSLSFDPGTEYFGFYSRWPAFSDRHLYSEDALNTFNGAIPHHVRVYPLKNADGTLVENAYVVATEEHTSGFDFQDIVVIVRNVRPAGQVTVASGNRINAGGPQFIDEQSRTWSADAYFSSSSISSKSFDVQGTIDDDLYLNYRYANPATNTANPGAPFNYSIPVESGEYNIKLHFLEPYYGAPGGVAGTAGSRVFHVDIEGQRILTDYDIFATEGAGKAVVKSFSKVNIADGKLDIAFTSVKNNAIVSAIEFEKVSITPPTAPVLAVSPAEVILDGVKGNTIGPKTLTLKNKGGEMLTIESVTKTGANESAFTLTEVPATIEAGDSAKVNVTFQPGSTVGVMQATLQIASNDPANPTKEVHLSGLSTNGFEGGNEPTLANVVKALGYGINVGWTSLSSGMGSDPVGDEALVPLFEKAGSGNVTIVPVARYSPAEELPFGWYTNSSGNVTLNQVGALLGGSPHHQTLFPGLASGGKTFDPQSAVFGIYVDSKTFNRKTYTENDLNAQTESGFDHRVRIYPVKRRDGQVVPNNYLVCFEDASNGDYQDYVYVLSNVVPVGARPTLAFNQNKLSFSVPEGGTSPSKEVTLNAQNGTPGAVTLTKSSNSNWLILPTGATGTLAFEVNVSGLAPGTYQSTVTASTESFVSATMEVSLEVTGFSANAVKVNFQLNTSATPEGYVEDAGLAFDEARGYGWITPSTKQPKDHTTSMRERSGSGELRLRTLALMQATTNNQTPGNWEYALPNGLYNVSVSAGDPDFFDSNHSINVEGVPAIIGFVPTPQAVYKAATVTVEVTDGKLTIDANGGINTKVNYAIIDPATSEGDKIAPVASIKLKGTLQSPGVYKDEVVMSIDASDTGGSGLAAVYYSLNDGPFTEYFAPLQIKQAGDYTISAKAVDGNNNEFISNVVSVRVVKSVPSYANMVVENLDKFPAADHLTFSNIQVPWQRSGTPFNENHNKVKLKISNKGAGPLVINDLTFSNAGAWKLAQLNGANYDAATALPITINTGASVEATVEFIANYPSGRVRVLHDTLYVTSNDDLAPFKKVQLHGLWQNKGEGSNEPYVQEIIDAFGFKTKTGFNSNDGSSDGNGVIPNSDEILSSFFVRADAAKPVHIIQLGAYHGCCSSTESFQWYAKGSTSNSTVFTHNALDGQSLLPRKNGSTTALAEGTFIPSTTSSNPTAAFGFKVSGSFSDRNRNSEGKIGLRIWKAIDANGNIIPNSYIIGHDYIGQPSVTNYDYQDNVFFVSNVRPESGPANYAELAAEPSAFDIGSVMVGASSTGTVNISNLGTTYLDGSSDPDIQVKSVEIVGQNLGDFVATMPTTSILAPQTSTAVSVDFRPSARGIKNAALMVHYNNSLSPLRIPLYGIADDGCSAISAVKRIKSASDGEVSIAGNVWESDKSYRKGNVQLDKPAATPIAGTDDDLLYQTYLSSTGDLNEIRYEIPVANGNYMVRMHFVENFWTTVGARVFNVSLENELRLSNLDIYREVGYKTALVKDFEVTVADGVLQVKFNPSANRVAIAGLEIYESTNSPGTLALGTKTVTGAACGVSDGSVELTVTNSEASSFLYKLGPNGAYQASALFENLTAGNYTFYAKEDIPNGCETSAVVIVPDRDNNLAFEISAPVLACSAASGTATVSNVTGGSGNYSYSWNTVPVQTSNIATNLAPGVYTVTVTDAATGCSKAQDVSIERTEDCVVTAIRINTGGAAYTAKNGDAFAADQYFTGNNSIVYSNTAIPDIAGTEDDAMYKTERSSNADLGGFSYNIPISNGSHTVKLHFAEIYSTSNNDIGRRVMNVKIEGEAALSNYDIIADVGVRTAVVKSFEVAVNDGVLNLDFGATANRPKVSAIEILTTSDPVNQIPTADAGGNQEVILPNTSVILNGAGSDAEDGTNVTFAWSQISGPNTAEIKSATTATTEVTGLVEGAYTFQLTVADSKGATATSDATVTVKPDNAGAVAIRINAGGGQMTAFGETFSADQYFTGNGKSYTNTQASIGGTTDDALYQSERSTLQNLQSFGYNIPVPNGKYILKLHFAEIYFGATGGGAGGVGKRVFSVTAEGNAIPGLTNYDIIADVGSMTAVVKEVEVDVTDGLLNLNFSASVNQPKVSAIEVLSISEPVNQAPTVALTSPAKDATFTAPANIALAAEASDTDGTVAKVEFFNDLTKLGEDTDGTNGWSFSWASVSAGIYTITAKATDDKGATTTSDVTSITVTEPVNQLPVADAGADQTVTLPTNLATLAGTGSDPEDGANITFAWSQLSGPNTATIMSAAEASTEVTDLVEGVYTFQLEVADTKGATATSNVTVTVKSAEYLLSVLKEGQGTVTPEGGTYKSGTVIEISAVPATGYSFVGWQGDETGIANPLPVTMDKDKSIVAVFSTNSFTVTATASTGGTVSVSPEKTNYSYGDEVTITATANEGYEFVGWTGSTSSSNTIVLNVTEDVSLTANFKQKEYTLTTTTNEGGTIIANPSGPTYAYGTVVTLTPQAQDGYEFSSWSGDFESSSNNSVTVVMDGNKAVEAKFAPLQYTVSAVAGNGGSVTVSPQKTSYAYNETVTITATPNAGYEFSSWSGDAESNANPLQISVKGNVSVTAAFNQKQFTLDVKVGTGGTVSKDPDQSTYVSGSTVTLTATPASGYQFSGWSGDTTGTTNPLTVSMNSDKSVTATFTSTSAQQQVTGFSLIDAHSEKEVMAITDGAVISLSSLERTKLNVQAHTSPGTVGSVRFELSGAQSKSYTDSKAPYSLHGDNGMGNFYYGNWNPPAAGTYTLKATPYSGAKGTGTAGTPLTVTFTFVENFTTTSKESVTAVFDKSSRLKLEVYPNPNSGEKLNVAVSSFGEREAVKIIIYSISGREVYTKTTETDSSGASNLEIKFGEPLTRGVYIIRATSASGTSYTKLLVN